MAHLVPVWLPFHALAPTSFKRVLIRWRNSAAPLCVEWYKPVAGAGFWRESRSTMRVDTACMWEWHPLPEDCAEWVRLKTKFAERVLGHPDDETPPVWRPFDPSDVFRGGELFLVRKVAAGKWDEQRPFLIYWHATEQRFVFSGSGSPVPGHVLRGPPKTLEWEWEWAPLRYPSPILGHDAGDAVKAYGSGGKGSVFSASGSERWSECPGTFPRQGFKTERVVEFPATVDNLSHGSAHDYAGLKSAGAYDESFVNIPVPSGTKLCIGDKVTVKVDRA